MMARSSLSTTRAAGTFDLACIGKSARSVIKLIACTVAMARKVLAGLTWIKRAATGGGSDIEEWYAIAASPLVADTITVTQTSANFLEVVAFGWSGANTSSPFAGSPDTVVESPVI